MDIPSQARFTTHILLGSYELRLVKKENLCFYQFHSIQFTIMTRYAFSWFEQATVYRQHCCLNIHSHLGCV